MLKVNFANLLLLKPRLVFTNSIRKAGSRQIKNFINFHPHLKVAHRIPAIYKKIAARDSIDYLYLVCPETARNIANHVLASVNLDKKQVIAEANAGLGLVSTELLERGVNRVRIYEKCDKCLSILQNFNITYPERVEIICESFFDLNILDLKDRHENQGRVHIFFKDIPKRAWTDDPMQDFDVGKMYLVKINFKKDFPVPAEHFIGLYHFIQQLYGRGNKCVIPLMEKFVPGSGFNAIVPSMNHKHFPKEVNIFTKFNELTPEEISTLFKETIMHPNYKSSPLMAMIEASFLKTELYDPYSVDDMEENIINEKMEMEEKF
nr:uncharacterized protein LOC111512425 [Leptinotarsa decemlineata]